MLMIIMTMPYYKSGKLMIITACYKSDNGDDESDNNKNNVCLLFKKMRFDKSYIKSYTRLHTRSHDYKFCDHGIIIVFFFGVSFNKQVIVKNYFQLGKKLLNTIRE